MQNAYKHKYVKENKFKEMSLAKKKTIRFPVKMQFEVKMIILQKKKKSNVSCKKKKKRKENCFLKGFPNF